jgi:hypothetical protein
VGGSEVGGKLVGGAEVGAADVVHPTAAAMATSNTPASKIVIGCFFILHLLMAKNGWR